MEALRLLDDGTIEFVMLTARPNGTIEPTKHVLRRPTLGELGEIMDLVEQGDVILEAKREAGESLSPLTSRPDMPYARAFALAVHVLAGAEIAPADLPGWAGGPRAIGACATHWREVPLDRGTPTPSSAAEPASNVARQSGAASGQLVGALRSSGQG